MKIMRQLGWLYYIADNADFDNNKVGKWMYFFKDEKLVEKICKNAVEKDIVKVAKHTADSEGVACFYLHYDDDDAHKRVIQYFLDNEMIRKTKTGKLYNISYKLDEQSRAGEYGADFSSDIKLEKFIDLITGEWI